MIYELFEAYLFTKAITLSSIAIDSSARWRDSIASYVSLDCSHFLIPILALPVVWIASSLFTPSETSSGNGRIDFYALTDDSCRQSAGSVKSNERASAPSLPSRPFTNSQKPDSQYP